MKRKIEKFLAERQKRTGEAQYAEDGRLNIDNDIDSALAAVRGRDPFGGRSNHLNGVFTNTETESRCAHDQLLKEDVKEMKASEYICGTGLDISEKDDPSGLLHPISLASSKVAKNNCVECLKSSASTSTENNGLQAYQLNSINASRENCNSSIRRSRSQRKRNSDDIARSAEALRDAIKTLDHDKDGHEDVENASSSNGYGTGGSRGSFLDGETSILALEACMMDENMMDIVGPFDGVLDVELTAFDTTQMNNALFDAKRRNFSSKCLINIPGGSSPASSSIYPKAAVRKSCGREMLSDGSRVQARGKRQTSRANSTSIERQLQHSAASKEKNVNRRKVTTPVDGGFESVSNYALRVNQTAPLNHSFSCLATCGKGPNSSFSEQEFPRDELPRFFEWSPPQIKNFDCAVTPPRAPDIRTSNASPKSALNRLSSSVAPFSPVLSMKRPDKKEERRGLRENRSTLHLSHTIIPVLDKNATKTIISSDIMTLRRTNSAENHGMVQNGTEIELPFHDSIDELRENSVKSLNISAKSGNIVGLNNYLTPHQGRRLRRKQPPGKISNMRQNAKTCRNNKAVILEVDATTLVSNDQVSGEMKASGAGPLQSTFREDLSNLEGYEISGRAVENGGIVSEFDSVAQAVDAHRLSLGPSMPTPRSSLSNLYNVSPSIGNLISSQQPGCKSRCLTSNTSVQRKSFDDVADPAQLSSSVSPSINLSQRNIEASIRNANTVSLCDVMNVNDVSSLRSRIPACLTPFQLPPSSASDYFHSKSQSKYCRQGNQGPSPLGSPRSLSEMSTNGCGFVSPTGFFISPATDGILKKRDQSSLSLAETKAFTSLAPFVESTSRISSEGHERDGICTDEGRIAEQNFCALAGSDAQQFLDCRSNEITPRPALRCNSNGSSRDFEGNYESLSKSSTTCSTSSYSSCSLSSFTNANREFNYSYGNSPLTLSQNDFLSLLASASPSPAELGALNPNQQIGKRSGGGRRNQNKSDTIKDQHNFKVLKAKTRKMITDEYYGKIHSPLDSPYSEGRGVTKMKFTGCFLERERCKKTEERSSQPVKFVDAFFVGEH